MKTHLFCLIVLLSAPRLALAEIRMSSIFGDSMVVQREKLVWLAADGVGDYTNTAIDLVANLFGAIAGTVYMHLTRVNVGIDL